MQMLDAVQKVEPGDSADVLALLRELLIGETYAPGERLPPERVLIERFGIKRSALRRALDVLEKEGRIWRHVGKGTFVAAAPKPVAIGGDDLGSLMTPMKVMRARQCIEPAIAREAAINSSADTINRLIDTHNRAAQAASWDIYEAEDDAFHRAVAEASDNPLLVSLFDQLNTVRRAVGWAKLVRDSDRPAANHRSFQEHQQILAAIQARDPGGAYEAMRAHIGSVSARLFGEL